MCLPSSIILGYKYFHLQKKLATRRDLKRNMAAIDFVRTTYCWVRIPLMAECDLGSEAAEKSV